MPMSLKPRGFVDAVRASLILPEERTEEVVRLFERDALYRSLQKALGSEHPTTARVRGNLAALGT